MSCSGGSSSILCTCSISSLSSESNESTSLIHQMASTMDAPPKMFVGTAILRLHPLQDTGHINARLAAPHTDCGIQHFLGEPELRMDGMYPKHTLKMQSSGGMIT